MADSDSDEEFWENYDSGPFCRHWSDVGDCDDLCICGHECRKHDFLDDNEPCNVEGCTCQKFIDQIQEPTQ